MNNIVHGLISSDEDEVEIEMLRNKRKKRPLTDHFFISDDSDDDFNNVS